jgi:hypothetical protein
LNTKTTVSQPHLGSIQLFNAKKAANARISVGASTEPSNCWQWAQAKNLCNEISGLLPCPVRSFPEPPFDPCPEVFNGIHLRVKFGKELADHGVPSMNFNQMSFNSFGTI